MAEKTRRWQVADWALSIGALHLGTAKFGRNDLELYIANGRVFIVEWFYPNEENSSFEVFVPATDDQKIQATFAAVEERLGIKNEAVSRPGREGGDA